MYSSLDRLIDLAKKTGDRLIIHDPIEGRDIVVMDVEHYERLVLERQDVRALSSDQMLDQINRDIAVWRSNKEMDEHWEREMQVEDEFFDENHDPFTDEFDFMQDWHRTGEILENRYKDNPWVEDDVFEDEEDVDMDRGLPFESEEELLFEEVDEEMPGTPEAPVEFEDEVPPVHEEIKVEDIPFEPVMDIETEWEEEPLGEDDPIFLEEPIN